MAGVKGGQGGGVDHPSRLGEREQKGNLKSAGFSRNDVRNRRRDERPKSGVEGPWGSAAPPAQSPAGRTAARRPVHRGRGCPCGPLRTIRPCRTRQDRKNAV